jgi:uncharacterized repeat protein (TIGR03803 family)
MKCCLLAGIPRLLIAIFLSISAEHSVLAQGRCVVLRSFGYPIEAGSELRSTILVTDAALYGTTFAGGSYNRGTVFGLRRNGRFDVLYSFSAGNNGFSPESGLVLAKDGALYGTAAGGGTRQSGVIFKLNTDGSGFKVVHNFDSQIDGREPRARLLEGTNGKLYGVTMIGGPSGGGALFALNTNGTDFKVLQAFSLSSRDGTTPAGELIEGDDSVLYGATAAGGIAQSGVVYKLNTDGSGFKVLHRFGPTGDDGRNPAGRLLRAGKVLYGVTSSGGPLSCGTIFKLNVDGSGYGTLHRFDNENRRPTGGLVRDEEGSLYGTTAMGGTYTGGSIFKLTADKKYSVVHHFGRLGLTADSNDGRGPMAGLTMDADGIIYGTTEAGGAYALGTIFSFE